MEKKILRSIVDETKYAYLYDAADDVRHEGNSVRSGDARLL
jgi:hypothetical protein